jgi:hypothetical protein
MSVMTYEVTTEDLRAAADELLSSWDATTNLETRARDVEAAMHIFGLTDHVHHAARATLLLVDNGLAHEAVPLMRKMLEFAAVTQWLRLKGDKGIKGFVLESGRQHRTSVKQALMIGMPLDVALELDEPLDKPHDDFNMRSFETVCKALKAPAMYTVYRSLSSYVHPSVAAVTDYVDFEAMALGGDRSDRVEVRERAAVWTTTAALLWSGRALDEQVRFLPRKKLLRAVGARVSIPTLLPDG